MRAKTLGAFFILSLILLLSQSGISLAQDPPPGVGSPITISDACMQDIAGFGLVCTANDVSLARATNITITHACEYPGDTVTFMATFETVLTAQARHDIGIYFATDGDPNHDGALSGQCSISSCPIHPMGHGWTWTEPTITCREPRPLPTSRTCAEISMRATAHSIR